MESEQYSSDLMKQSEQVICCDQPHIVKQGPYTGELDPSSLIGQRKPCQTAMETLEQDYAQTFTCLMLLSTLLHPGV